MDNQDIGKADLLDLSRSLNDAHEAKGRIEQSKSTGQTGPALAKATQDYKTATNNVQQIAEKNQRNPEIQKTAGQGFLELGEPTRAMPLTQRAVELNPKDPVAYVLRGNAEYQLGNYEAAKKDARIAMRLDPDNKNAFALMKLTEDRTGPASPLAASEQKGSGAAPGSSKGGIAAAQTGKTSIEDMNRAGPPLHIQNRELGAQAADRANAELKLGNYAEAAANATKAIDMGVKAPRVYGLRSAAEIRMNQFPQALADAETEQELDPAHGSAYLHRAQAEEGLHYPADDVLADYRRAATLDPNLAGELKSALQRYQEHAREATGTDAASSSAGPAAIGSKNAGLFMKFWAPLSFSDGGASHSLTKVTAAALILLGLFGLLTWRRDGTRK